MEPVKVPISDEFTRKRKYMAVVSIVAALIALSAFIATSSYSVDTVNIISVKLEISYVNSSNKWLGPSTQFLTANYKTLYAGADYNYSITLTNHYSEPESISDIKVNSSGFSLQFLSSNLPLTTIPMTLIPGESQTVFLLIKLPEYNYVGDLVVTIDAS